MQCHGPDYVEGNIRIDTLNPDLANGPDAHWWLEIQAVLSNGEMPPPDAKELRDSDRSKVVEWLADEIQRASKVRRATGGHSSFRRMTQYEYNYALQDLLGVPWNFAKDLPPESHSDDGFQNSSELLHMSVGQLESYRQIALNALRRVTVKGERSPVIHWGVSMKEAADREWPKQQQELDKVKEQFKDDPAKLQQEVDRLTASFRVAIRCVRHGAMMARSSLLARPLTNRSFPKPSTMSPSYRPGAIRKSPLSLVTRFLMKASCEFGFVRRKKRPRKLGYPVCSWSSGFRPAMKAGRKSE